MKNKLFDPFVPYLVAGFAIALAIGLFFILFQVLIWGVTFAVIIYLAVVIKKFIMAKLYPPKHNSKKHKGIIIEHDDL